jgi:hypothetical protein
MQTDKNQRSVLTAGSAVRILPAIPQGANRSHGASKTTTPPPDGLLMTE